jgi:hypothetical protein
MRIEVGVLIGPTYLISDLPFQRMDSFSDWRPALPFPHMKRYIVRFVTADFNGASKFPCFLGILDREDMVWKHRNRAAKLSPQTPANRNFFQIDLAVVLFKFNPAADPLPHHPVLLLKGQYRLHGCTNQLFGESRYC